MGLFLISGVAMYIATWALFFVPIVATFILYDVIIAIIKKLFLRR